MPNDLDFEWDPGKSRQNELKHGISFELARLIWIDDMRVEIQACSLEEPRHVVIGRIGSRLFAAVITYRGARIRLISVRRARGREVIHHESQEI
ncbi:MAG TPA: BrnT family toxin [Candidatus Eisenbacteria bacterium]